MSLEKGHNLKKVSPSYLLICGGMS